MSRRKKSPEERLVDIVEEIGFERTKAWIDLIELFWKKWVPSTSQAPDLAGMVKRSLTLPKTQPTRQSAKKTDLPEAVGDKP